VRTSHKLIVLCAAARALLRTNKREIRKGAIIGLGIYLTSPFQALRVGNFFGKGYVQYLIPPRSFPNLQGTVRAPRARNMH
jgi:hypothetical protein